MGQHASARVAAAWSMSAPKVMPDTGKEVGAGYNVERKKRVVVSGYFDPFHVGHLEYLEKSKVAAGGDKGAHLIVIVNNDHQATLKKGKPFMPAAERVKIVTALRGRGVRGDRRGPHVLQVHRVHHTSAGLLLQWWGSEQHHRSRAAHLREAGCGAA